MREGKAFASLSSGLLARKGQARPAMRPQGFGFNTGNLDDLGWNDMGHDAGPRAVTARLPANLAGPAPATPIVAPVPPVVRQQEEIAREFAAVVEEAPAVIDSAVIETPVVEAVAEAPEPEAPAAPKKAKAAKRVSPPKAVAPVAAGRKAAFTLRLDADRHLRLRLACAVQNRSAQMLVTDALDQLLGSLPDVARLAASLPAKD